jgi:hypothetical protein
MRSAIIKRQPKRPGSRASLRNGKAAAIGPEARVSVANSQITLQYTPERTRLAVTRPNPMRQPLLRTRSAAAQVNTTRGSEVAVFTPPSASDTTRDSVAAIDTN